MKENGESAVRFGKLFNLMIFLTTRVALLCCKSHRHAANIKFWPNACSSCFKQYFPFLPGGENIHIITLLNPLPVLIILLNPSPVLVALKILRYVLSFTRSINTRRLVGCLENSDRKIIKNNSVFYHGLLQVVLQVYCSSIQCLMNVSGSAT